MDKEVADIILQGLSELRREFAELRTQLTDEHRVLGERVARLEEFMKNTRYWYAAMGGAVLIGLKELVFWIARDLMPRLNDEAAHAFIEVLRRHV